MAASPTTSGSEVALDVITGVPNAIASSGGSPNPSPSEGNTNTSAPAYQQARSSSRTYPGRRIRGDLWRRRATLAAACLGCFGLGWMTTYLRPTPEPVVEYVEVPAATPVADAPGSPGPGPVVRARSPAELELEAEQIAEPAEAARRFRQAGDRYLLDRADYRGALRCYRNFLDEADPADRAASADDTWLLASLKRAREQETSQ